MKRNYISILVPVLCSLTVLSGAMGWVVGLWSSCDLSSIGTLFLRGLLLTCFALIISLIPAWILAVTLSRSSQDIIKAVQSVGQGSFDIDLQVKGPREMVELANEVRELGFSFEELEKVKIRSLQQDARKHRLDALHRFGLGITKAIQASFSGLAGYAEMAMKQPGVKGQLKDFLTLIEQEAHSGRKVLEKILFCTRQEPFALDPLDVNEIILDTTRVWFSALEKEGIKLQLNLGSDLPKVLGEANQLKFVIQILVNNAREAVLPKGGVLSIDSNTDNQGQMVIMVKDNGKGIAEEQKHLIFTPFFTTKEGPDSFGLNLAIVERIVALHQGQIDFWSHEGDGTVFFITLPVVAIQGGTN